MRQRPFLDMLMTLPRARILSTYKVELSERFKIRVLVAFRSGIKANFHVMIAYLLVHGYAI